MPFLFISCCDFRAYRMQKTCLLALRHSNELVFKNLAIDIRYRKRIYMNKICEREPYSSRILASLLSRASKLFRGYGEARREKEILPLFPFPPLEPRGIFLAGYLIRLAVDSVFAARELQEITLSIASLLLNCFVNLAPLGLYSSLIFSLMLKKIHRETLLKLVQQTNMRNWRTCVWNRKSKSWFVSSRLRDEKEAKSQERTVFADKGTTWLQSWRKVMRFSHFLTHRTPIPSIWYRYDPSPRPTLVKVV